MSSREENAPVEPTTDIIVDVIIGSSDEEPQNETVLDISSDDNDSPLSVSPQSRKARFGKPNNPTGNDAEQSNIPKRKVLRKRAYSDTSIQEPEDVLATPADKTLVGSFFGTKTVVTNSGNGVSKST
jgi:hypothetical protein